jgi:hypothetical protein
MFNSGKFVNDFVKDATNLDTVDDEKALEIKGDFLRYVEVLNEVTSNDLTFDETFEKERSSKKKPKKDKNTKVHILLHSEVDPKINGGIVNYEESADVVEVAHEENSRYT